MLELLLLLLLFFAFWFISSEILGTDPGKAIAATPRLLLLGRFLQQWTQGLVSTFGGHTIYVYGTYCSTKYLQNRTIFVSMICVKTTYNLVMRSKSDPLVCPILI